MKKFPIVALTALMLSGCNTVIYEKTSNGVYSYDLTFDRDDVDYSYKENSKYVLLEGDGDFSITTGGTYILNGSMNGSVIINTTSEVKLVLDNVTINSDDFAAIYIKQCEKCTITLVGENTLSDNGSEYTQVDENTVDGVIFSKDDLVLNGEGTLNIEANYKHGIVSKDDLTITSGTYYITSISHGIVGKDCVKIKDGTFNIESGKTAIKSNNDEDEGRGYIYISGGEFELSAGNKGLQAYNDLIIDGGTINITKSYEGLEAANITLNDGIVTIQASDDGINAANKGDGTSTLKINGGCLYINAEGDGVDSNGDIYISGGTIFIEGPTSGGDAAFDYETDAYVSGGEILMIGQNDMAEGFNDDGSSQVSLLYNLDKSYSVDTKLVITVGSKTIVSKTISKQFNSILVSSSKMAVGDEITIQVGDDTYTYTLESMSNTYGESNFGQKGNVPEGDENFDPDNKPSGDFDPTSTGMPSGERPEMPNGNKEFGGEKPSEIGGDTSEEN